MSRHRSEDLTRIRFTTQVLAWVLGAVVTTVILLGHPVLIAPFIAAVAVTIFLRERGTRHAGVDEALITREAGHLTDGNLHAALDTWAHPGSQ